MNHPSMPAVWIAAACVMVAVAACHRDEKAAYMPAPQQHYIAYDRSSYIRRFYDDEWGMVCYESMVSIGASASVTLSCNQVVQRIE